MTNFKRFFFRGLGIILPTVLTTYLVVIAYGFVNDYIAEPLNQGVRESLIRFSYFPAPTHTDIDKASSDLPAELEQEWAKIDDTRRDRQGASYGKAQQLQERRNWVMGKPDIMLDARRLALVRIWNSYTIGNWAVLDLVGLFLAAVLIYFVGIVLGSYIGRSIYKQAEDFVMAIPLISRVYPSVKQVTDFFFGDKPDQRKINFNRVVAVQYPRMGLWSVGLVTGDTMRDIEDKAGMACLTVFVPSSPTPFTGYVITVPRNETVDLPITIEEALKFAVSGGVLIPPGQVIESHKLDFDSGLVPIQQDDSSASPGAESTKDAS
ncbi:DUF502 domain-containing protein [Mucisphaera calidilacus]|uniref:DUF502 domain-containing protein n=1 Tax=Mucisphaera calidilacus TaxID=2527982 RepID=A0A518BW17_9BACT|nr:DUF502 domain-containing protein [Mucisphaera calidilacus]QDU71169.1 hypothetical protein Pan265_10180 [Mucisphaera calidilacus]